MKYMTFVLSAIALLAGSGTSEAAVGTTCLCRANDGKSFVENTFRHHRWACDFRYGYAKGGIGGRQTRPITETCNSAEITQFKTYICVSNGCSYGYTEAATEGNKALKVIEPMKGKRTP
jgi:hypothetical protein